MLPINEMFASIQGEGGLAGTPSVFVRLQGCLVGCPFCDTKESWDLQAGSEDPDRIAELIGDRWPHYRHVVVTGGEPLMHDISRLVQEIQKTGRSVQVETSGVYEIKELDGVFVTVSPKRQNLETLHSSLRRAEEIKHLVGKDAHAHELKALLADSGVPDETPIYLQPLSMSGKSTEVCIRQAAEHGWKVSIQAHKILGVR